MNGPLKLRPYAIVISEGAIDTQDPRNWKWEYLTDMSLRTASDGKEALADFLMEFEQFRDKDCYYYRVVPLTTGGQIYTINHKGKMVRA